MNAFAGSTCLASFHPTFKEAPSLNLSLTRQVFKKWALLYSSAGFADNGDKKKFFDFWFLTFSVEPTFDCVWLWRRDNDVDDDDDDDRVVRTTDEVVAAKISLRPLNKKTRNRLFRLETVSTEIAFLVSKCDRWGGPSPKQKNLRIVFGASSMTTETFNSAISEQNRDRATFYWLCPEKLAAIEASRFVPKRRDT